MRKQSSSPTAKRSVSKEDLSAWMKEGMKKKKEREDVKVAGMLQMSIEELFHVEPSRRGQRRANLFKQRMNEAAEEEAIRKGKGSQAFWEAARVGNMDEIMNKLFRQKGFVPSDKDLSHGIHAAAVHGREDVIDILIRHGANPSDNDMPQGFTPLMVASARGHVHAMLLLIDRGAQLDSKNDMLETALHLAARNGHAHAVKCLVAEGAESWHKDKNGCTPMDYCKSDSEEHERCGLILGLAKPRDKVKVRMPDTQDVDGETPAHHYLVQSMYGHPRVCNASNEPSNLV